MHLESPRRAVPLEEPLSRATTWVEGSLQAPPQVGRSEQCVQWAEREGGGCMASGLGSHKPGPASMVLVS